MANEVDYTASSGLSDVHQERPETGGGAVGKMVNTMYDQGWRAPKSASDMQADLYRSEWQDYVRNFRPFDQTMVDLATGEQDNKEAIRRAGQSAGLAFDSAERTRDRDMSRMGLTEAADEREDRENRTARNKTASEVNARNQARLHTQSRDQNLLGGNLAVGLRDMDQTVGI